jgi:lipopolysaccharide biosynthesis glycosyltransferase
MNDKLDAIFVATHAAHVYLAKILCQSIRHFCGYTLPIVIIPDGPCNLSQMKKRLGVLEFDNDCVAPDLRFLSGYYSKLKILFNAKYERFLYLDADTILLSDPYKVPFANYDFFVSGGVEDVQDNVTRKRVAKLIFDADQIKNFDSDFRLDNFVTFNSGQFFAKSGIVEKELVFRCLDYSSLRSSTPIFRYYDQGIFNYIFNKLQQQNIASLGYGNFALFPHHDPQDKFIDMTPHDILMKNFSSRIVAHFTGPSRKYGFIHTSYQWLPKLFQDMYYSELPFGTRHIDMAAQWFLFATQKILRRFKF